jgi:hypothetical protein
MSRNEELRIIAAYLEKRRARQCPPAFVAPTKQGELALREEKRRVKRLKISLPSGNQRPAPFLFGR